jgi:hypothetical protein
MISKSGITVPSGLGKTTSCAKIGTKNRINKKVLVIFFQKVIILILNEKNLKTQLAKIQ